MTISFAQLALTKEHITKNSVLSVLLGLLIIAVLFRITPAYVDPVIKLVISKNRATITNIHQPRDIELTKEAMVDKLDLADKNKFRHPKLGELGYTNDFFVDVNHEITVKKEGEYRFYVSSDDGFSLNIDGKMLCEHVRDRPLTTQSCLTRLSVGKHQVNLVYFQGFGNAGLRVEYASTKDDDMHTFGEDSKYITF